VTAAVTVTVTVTVPATASVTVTVPVPVSVPVPVTVKVTVTVPVEVTVTVPVPVTSKATRMSDLANSFRKAAVFNEARAKDDSKRRLEAFGKNADIFQLHVEAARFEHAYSRPLLELAAKAIEALYPVAECGNCGGCRDTARKALAEIRSAVEGK